VCRPSHPAARRPRRRPISATPSRGADCLRPWTSRTYASPCASRGTLRPGGPPPYPERPPAPRSAQEPGGLRDAPDSPAQRGRGDSAPVSARRVVARHPRRGKERALPARLAPRRRPSLDRTTRELLCGIKTFPRRAGRVNALRPAQVRLRLDWGDSAPAMDTGMAAEIPPHRAAAIAVLPAPHAGAVRAGGRSPARAARRGRAWMSHQAVLCKCRRPSKKIRRRRNQFLHVHDSRISLHLPQPPHPIRSIMGKQRH
jgi:hypothetical protein